MQYCVWPWTPLRFFAHRFFSVAGSQIRSDQAWLQLQLQSSWWGQRHGSLAKTGMDTGRTTPSFAAQNVFLLRNHARKHRPMGLDTTMKSTSFTSTGTSLVTQTETFELQGHFHICSFISYFVNSPGHIWSWYPLVNSHIAMENHHAINYFYGHFQ